MATLFELTTEYKNLLDKLEDVDASEEVIKDTIDSTGINDDIESKFEGYAMVIRELMAEEEKVQKVVAMLNKKKKTYQNSIVRLKSSLMDSMKMLGKEKVKTTLFNVSINHSPFVDIVDIDMIPENLIKVEVKPDKNQIKSLINSGKEVPGAEIGKRESLTVR